MKFKYIFKDNIKKMKASSCKKLVAAISFLIILQDDCIRRKNGRSGY